MFPIFLLGFSLLNIICLGWHIIFVCIVTTSGGFRVFPEKSAVSLSLQLSIYILCYIYILSVLIMLKGFSFLVLSICCSLLGGGG